MRKIFGATVHKPVDVLNLDLVQHPVELERLDLQHQRGVLGKTPTPKHLQRLILQEFCRGGFCGQTRLSQMPMGAVV